MTRPVSILALMAALIAASVPTATLAAPASGGRGGNVTQQRENRSDADQWKRSESKSSDEHADDEEEDSDSDHDKSDEKKERPKHPGELNGKLHLGEW